MYETFYQLSRRPFPTAPQVDRYFPSAAIEQARQSLVRCIERAEGIGLVLSQAGGGKSMLCQLLADQFQGRLEIALLAAGKLSTTRTLLQVILYELGLAYRGLDEGELRLALIDHASQLVGPKNGVLLLVDDADQMSPRLLDELRMIADLVRMGDPKIRLILVGAMVLEEILASPKMQQLNQRIRVRCNLPPLETVETGGYIEQQLRTAGAKSLQIFTQDAIAAIQRATGGIPRLINQLCDHALMLGFAGGRKTIDGYGVKEAWADLEQLPAPARTASTPATGGDQSSVIEFGALADEPAVHPAPIATPPTQSFEVPARRFDSPALLGETPKLLGESVSMLSNEPAHTFAAAEHAYETPARTVERSMQSLDTLSAHVNQLYETYEVSSSTSSASGATQLDRTFVAPRPADAHQFDEEEVVIDHYVDFQAGCGAHAHRVASAEGAELAALIGAVGATSQVSRTTTTVELPVAAKLAQAPVRPTLQPAAKRITTAVVPAQAAVPLIEVDDKSRPAANLPTVPAVVVRRQHYRQLFAKLRHG